MKMNAVRMRWWRRVRFVAMTPFLPAAFGGCQDIRNGVVDAFEGAANVLVSDVTGSGPEGALQRGLVNAFADVFFERLRNDTP